MVHVRNRFWKRWLLFFHATPKGSQRYSTWPAPAYAYRLDGDSNAPVSEISDVGFQADFPATSLPEAGQASGVAFRVSGRSGFLGISGDFWEPVVRDSGLVGWLAEHVRDSLEQLFKEFGKVVPPDRPTVSALGFHVIVRYVETIQLSVKLSVALQQKIIDSAGNPEQLSIVACI